MASLHHPNIVQVSRGASQHRESACPCFPYASTRLVGECTCKSDLQDWSKPRQPGPCCHPWPGHHCLHCHAPCTLHTLILTPLYHPPPVCAILQFLGICILPPAVITELCPRGSLAEVIRQARQPEAPAPPPADQLAAPAGGSDSGGLAAPAAAVAGELTWWRRLSMALDGARGMLYLHSRAPAILHRDLKVGI